MSSTMTLESVLSSIHPVDRRIEPEIDAHLASLTKPLGSLGRLEDIAKRVALVTGEVRPVITGKAIVTFAADHGVTEEKISAYPKEVTPQMVRNILAGGAAINQLTKHVGSRLYVVDVGVDDPLSSAPGLIRRKIRNGTRNFLREPAMTREETLAAIGVGFEMAGIARAEGALLIGTGEMGIGNTTPSAALMAALLPCEPSDVTGRGTGINDETFRQKVQVINAALERYGRPRLFDPLEALTCVGGLEIAAICGLLLGAAAQGAVVVIDGFISSAGALVALRLCPSLRDYLLFSHCSAEAGHRRFFDELGEEPLLDLGMRLGEGSGAALAMSIIEAAVLTSNHMATFDSAGVAGKSEGC